MLSVLVRGAQEAMVLHALQRDGKPGVPTYVVRNWIQMLYQQKWPTAAVRKVLFRLERAGRVKRVETGYARMLCWSVAAP